MYFFKFPASRDVEDITGSIDLLLHTPKGPELYLNGSGEFFKKILKTILNPT